MAAVSEAMLQDEKAMSAGSIPREDRKGASR